MKAHNLLEQTAAGLNTLIGGILKNIFGENVDHSLVGPITWSDVIVSALIIVLALLLNELVMALLRYKARKSEPGASKNVAVNSVAAMRKPVTLFVWLCGAYIAAVPLLMRFPEEQNDIALRIFLSRSFKLGIFVALIWLFFRFTHVLEGWLATMAAKTENKLDDLFVPLVGRSLRIILPVVGIIFGLPILGLPPEYAGVVSKGTGILLIIGMALILFQAVRLGEKAMLMRFDITVSDNLRARKVYTQVHVISKVVDFIICLFTVASILMLFDAVRHFGASILASAGVVGIILGFAAQKTIANLFAGFQLAMAEPIRLDDVVIVEGEWGRVEEITLTYVVISIWDERRLIVPLGYFIDKPFQNWTRVSAGLLGSILLSVDYSLPLEEIRKAVKGIIESHPLWDKRFWNLQVSDATERTMQIRILATSADSSKAWDLRCDVREKVIAYIQKNYPKSLPQFRVESAALPHAPTP